MKVKSNGFTLMELLAVVSILGILAVIVTPNVIRTLNKSRNNVRKVQESTLLRAAKDFTASKSDKLGDQVCVQISTLQSLGFLEEGTIKDSTDENITYNNKYYNITWSNNQYQYTLSDSCTSGYVAYTTQTESSENSSSGGNGAVAGSSGRNTPSTNDDPKTGTSSEQQTITVDNSLTTIITNESNSNSDMYTDNYGNIRYYGLNPNNYVTFNGETWRIIGKINNYIKIVNMNDTASSWGGTDSTNTNWSNSLVKGSFETVLNNMSSTAKNMIQQVTWYLGGFKYDDASNMDIDDLYQKEIGSEVKSGNSTTWTGSIGTISLSDFGYSMDDWCINTYDPSLLPHWGSYNNWNCHKTSWLYANLGSGIGTMTVSSNSAYIYGINNTYGFSTFTPETHDYVFYPVVYLKNTVRITSGDGRQSNPYQLAI